LETKGKERNNKEVSRLNLKSFLKVIIDRGRWGFFSLIFSRNLGCKTVCKTSRKIVFSELKCKNFKINFNVQEKVFSRIKSTTKRRVT